MNETTTYLVLGGGGLLVAGASIAFGVALRPTGPLGKAVGRYITKLDGECRFQCWAMDGRQMFARQIGAIVLSIVACVLMQETLLWVLPPLFLLGPVLALRIMRKKRVERIDAQLDGWLLILSNMLKTSGGLADSMAASVDLIRAPLRQELDQLLKEVRLGATLDDALRQMAARVKSSTLGAVVTVLLVGKRTGGELPALLETAAASLREMARLEGVIRTKTAEGRMQVVVLAVAPLGAYFGFKLMDPHFFDPLTESLIGYSIIGLSIVLWLLALYTARKILNVDY